MCEYVQVIRFILFFFIFLMPFFVVCCGVFFCKKNNLNINAFSSVIEMYRYVFMFKNKIFSICILFFVYGGAMMVVILLCITFWAEGHGCIFPTKYS